MLANRRKAIQIVSGTVGAAVVAGASVPPVDTNEVASVTKRAPLPFPEKGRFAIPIKPAFRLRKDGKSEIVVCHGELVVEVHQPAGGANELSVRLADWSATGNTELLGGAFELRHAPENVTATGNLVPLGKEGFPAVLTMTVPYEIVTRHGIAKGVKVLKGSISSLPPAPADLLDMSDAKKAQWSDAAPEIAAISVDSLISACV